jgi:hypothetical protein
VGVIPRWAKSQTEWEGDECRVHAKDKVEVKYVCRVDTNDKVEVDLMDRLLVLSVISHSLRKIPIIATYALYPILSFRWSRLHLQLHIIFFLFLPSQQVCLHLSVPPTLSQ